jgi:hypothetical protein
VISFIPHDPLEILRLARITLSDPNEEFEFGDWNRCTCGHIYQATVEEFASESRVLDGIHHDPATVRLMADVAYALGWVPWESSNSFDPEYVVPSAHTYISDATVEGLEMRDDSTHRQGALKVIDEAIATLQAQQEAAMQAVAEQASTARIEVTA